MTISAWHLIGNCQPMRERCMETGDRLGARLLTARLCRLITDLAFLQERRYHPYDKWYGAAFARLDAADRLIPLLGTALCADDTTAEASAVSQTLVALGHAHNDLGISRPVTPRLGDFEVGVNNAVRPYTVINAADFIAATREAMDDQALKTMIQVGAIDQLTHADDAIVTHTDWPAHLTDVYRREMGTRVP